MFPLIFTQVAGKRCDKLIGNDQTHKYALARKTQQEARIMGMIVHFNQW